MKRSCKALAVFAMAVAVSTGCYPTRRQHSLTRADLYEQRFISAPSKIHMYDGSVVLADSGFVCLRDTIVTRGVRYSFLRERADDGKWRIPLDSVAAVEYYEMREKDLRAIGSLLLVSSATAEIAAASALILKIIFGSCPTVYSFDAEQERLEAECFSYSIGRMFEADDLDRMSKWLALSDSLTLRVKNEALETHYINVLKLRYVDHPENTEAFPTGDRGVFIAGNPVPPVSAINSEGTDVLPYVRGRDELVYETDSAAVARMFSRGKRDWIECSVPVPEGATNAKLLLRLKNSLESTVLVYDVLMRDQGLAAVQWSRALNESWWYAWKLSRWYSEFSGIGVDVMQGGRYVRRAKIPDTGPIAWKYVGAQIPTWRCGDTLRVKLSFFPDNWIIDWIGFGFDGHSRARLKDVLVDRVCDQSRAERDDYIRALRRNDGRYAVTYPGEWLDVSFRLPPASRAERTYFLYSKGYYVEWVRGEWIRDMTYAPELDLSKDAELVERLAALWVAKKNSFKKRFLKHRVPAWNPTE
jgi:hypothetical protein